MSAKKSLVPWAQYEECRLERDAAVKLAMELSEEVRRHKAERARLGEELTKLYVQLSAVIGDAKERARQANGG